MLLPSGRGYLQVRTLASIPSLVCSQPSLFWKTIGLLVQKQGYTWKTQGQTGHPQLPVAMYGVLLSPFLGWHEPASDRSSLMCSSHLPNSAGHWLATGLLPFHLLPAQRLPIQRPSQKRQKRRHRRQMGAFASDCPPSGHCNGQEERGGRGAVSLCLSSVGGCAAPTGNPQAAQSAHPPTECSAQGKDGDDLGSA